MGQPLQNLICYYPQSTFGHFSQLLNKPKFQQTAPILAPSQPWLNALLHKKRLKCGSKAITDLLIWQIFTPKTCNSDCCQMQWQEDEYCEVRLTNWQKCWLVLNIKSHLIVGPCPTPPIIPHSPITPLSACGLRNSNLRRLKWVFLLLLGQTCIPF